MQESLARRGLLNAAQRESLAHNYAQISAVYRATGPPAEAVKAAEQALAYARTGSELATARALSHLALAQLFAGDPAQARANAIASQGLFGRTAAQEPDRRKTDDRLASLAHTIGTAEARMALFDEAVAHFHEAIALRERHLEAPVFDSIQARELVIVYLSLGDVLGAVDRFSLGRSGDAAAWYRQALALAERSSDADAKNASARFEIARSAGKLGAVLEDAQPGMALALYERSLHVSETLLPEGQARDDLRASAYGSMAVPLAKLGRDAEAHRKLGIARALTEADLLRNPGSRSALSDLADEWLEWGQIERPSGSMAAVEAYRKSLGFADRAAQGAPKDFSVAFRQVQAMEALIAAGAPEKESIRKQLSHLWAKWNRLQPGSPFIQHRLRAALAATNRP